MRSNPSAAQRRILECLASGASLVMPPWSAHIQLVAPGEVGMRIPVPTFRVLLRHAWIVRVPAADQQSPRYGLSDAGRAALKQETVGEP